MKEGRILKTRHGTFDLAPWNGLNESGIEPLCDKVLVRVDAALAKVGSIHITDQSADQQTLASTTGLLVAVGPQAFVWNSDRTVRWEGERPAAGTRVCFERYAGQEYYGVDGVLYRVMDDRSIGAAHIVQEQKARAPLRPRGVTSSPFAA